MMRILECLIVCVGVMAAAPGGAAAAAPPPTHVVEVNGAHAVARAALARGDGDAALAALAPADRLAAPGLEVRAHRAAGRHDEGCAVAVPAHGAGHRHRLVCAAAAGDDAAAAAALGALVDLAPPLAFADDAAVDALPRALAKAPLTVAEAAARALRGRAVAPFEAPARARDARAARALIAALPSSSTARVALLERIAFELPELSTAAERAAVPAFATPAGKVRVATTLERLHKSADVVQLVADLVGTDCDAALLIGKSERKQKRFAAARKALQAAQAPSCPPETRKKAAYLEARAASVQRGKGAEAELRGFIDAYPKDALTDDVLLWLAEVQMAGGRPDAARATLLRIATEHSDGDMADEARARVALDLARAGDVARARALFDDGVLALRRQPVPRVAELDRARYWAARLRAAPVPDTWAKEADQATFLAGVDGLAALAAERPLSFYGHLAGLVAASLGGRAASPVAIPPAPPTAPVPPAVAAQPAFMAALSFAADGFDEEAAVMLGEVVVERFDVAGATAVAAVSSSVGRLDLAHRALRARGLALLPGAPAASVDVLPWSLAWPRAYETELTTAANAHRVPPHLMRGLAREESTFDASIVSWAGAVGLCQLMPSTALDEAKSLKLPLPTTADLTNPALNATLGASHLGRRLRGLRHPFKAIAAYNAGPGAVLKWVPRAGATVPIDAWVESIPFDETRGYVKKVTGSWVTYAQLEGAPLPSFPLSL